MAHRLTSVRAGEALHSVDVRQRPEPGTMGAFIGISWTEYAQLAARQGGTAGPYTAQGAVLSVAAGRISYHFGFKGPSMAIGAHIGPLFCSDFN